MTSVDALREQVASRWARLDLPAWPDPHPGDVTPGEEEYSRVTDPGRYRVVHARGRLWADVLGELPGVVVEPLGTDAAPSADGRAFDRGVRVVPGRAGALPLLLLERDVPSAPGEPPLAVLDVAVGRPDVVVDASPGCGCDACDTGSADLLAGLDEAVARVVGGPFVVLRGGGVDVVWHPDGWSASARRRRGVDAAVEVCRRLAAGERVRLPRGAEALVGSPSLG